MNQNNTSDYIMNLEQVIYGAYVKKDHLKDIVYNTYGNSSIASATHLNVFVDVNSILHPLYSEKNRIMYKNITDISAGLINLCAHYRSYFRTLQVTTRFFLINSLNTCELNRKFIANYNGIFAAKAAVTRTKNMIDNNMALLRVLTPYLPDIFLIESEEQWETAVIIANLIETINDGNPNLIISHDLYPVQLTALYPYTSYLYPKKVRTPAGTVDDSWMLPINEKSGFREEFWNQVCSIRKTKASSMYPVSPLNYALVAAMSHTPERGISGMYNTLQAKKFITSIVGEEDIKIQSSMFLSNPEISSKYAVADIAARYNAMDVQYALPFYKASPEAKNIKLVNLDDPATVNRISAKYYQNNPLDLQNL